MNFLRLALPLVAGAFLLLTAATANAQNNVVLVDFGGTSAGNQFSALYPTWNIVLRNTATTQYVSGTMPSVYEGITEVPGNGEEVCWIGIRGSAPINFAYGQRIKCTWYNRGEIDRTLRASISFSDSTSIDGAVLEDPWYGMYNYELGDYGANVSPGTRMTLFFNLTNAASVLAAGSPPSEGNRYCINIARRFWPGEEGDLVLEKIELSTDADLTPPNPPFNLTATLASLAPGEPNHAVRLNWQKPADPNGPGSAHVSGISRYLIYRNGQLFDALDSYWSAYQGNNLEYVDNSALPGQSYTYAVTALDKAIKGRNPSWHNYATQRHGNESTAASVSVTMPSFDFGMMFNPFGMQYLGRIRLDGVEYAGRSMTCDPTGNPGYNPATHLPGSLYFTGHAQVADIGEISIPKPVDTDDYEAMPVASFLTPFTFPWPDIYNYDNTLNPFPAGSGDRWVGLGWHPGAGNVPAGIYYSTFMSYAGDVGAHSHGWINLTLNATTSPWGLDDPDEAGSQLLPFFHTGKFITALPQTWANTHLGGRSLLTGLGWPISGQGWPSCGPSLYACAPWSGGALPADYANTPSTKLLRYGSTFQTATWQRNWTQANNYQNAAWVAGGNNRNAIAISGQLAKGDNWYGGEQGDQSIYVDNDVPTPPTGSGNRGQNATLYRSMLQFYNPADLTSVAAGTKQAHEPQPYAILNIAPYLMRQDTDVTQTLKAIAIDNTNGYLYAYEQEYNYEFKPVVHVWKIGCLTSQNLIGMNLRSGAYRSAGALTSSASSVGAGESVAFISDTSVSLNSDFTVELGAHFEALIQACPSQ